jgi:type IV pilus assembly protein PilP
MRNIRLILAVPALLFLGGCAGDATQDIKTWMEEQKRDLRPSIPSMPASVVYRPVDFDSKGKLDPFDVHRFEPESKASRASEIGAPDFEARERRNNIMEKYPLESMKLIGIATINNQLMGVIAVDTMTKQVKVGEYIGVDFGLITKISETELSLKEMVEDADGVWTERVNTLLLQTKEDGR